MGLTEPTTVTLGELLDALNDIPDEHLPLLIDRMKPFVTAGCHRRINGPIRGGATPHLSCQDAVGMQRYVRQGFLAAVKLEANVLMDRIRAKEGLSPLRLTTKISLPREIPWPPK
jgi:hypothetical protein